MDKRSFGEKIIWKLSALYALEHHLTHNSVNDMKIGTVPAQATVDSSKTHCTGSCQLRNIIIYLDLLPSDSLKSAILIHAALANTGGLRELSVIIALLLPA